MQSLNEKVAVVTGAGSGIGRATAIRLAQLGCHVAISDVNSSGLAETAANCEELGVTVHQQSLNVADKDAIYAYAQQVQQHFGRVNIVINNAGVALTDTVEHTSAEDFNWLFDINFWGVVNGTQAFLPLLKAAGEGHIVNISSIFGIITVPTQSAYNAAKFAVYGFTGALRQELDIENCGVSATSVHPGGIKTNIFSSGRMRTETRFSSQSQANDFFQKMARTTPEQAADRIVLGILKNKRRVLIGWDAKLYSALQRISPDFNQWLIAKLVNKHFLRGK